MNFDEHLCLFISNLQINEISENLFYYSNVLIKFFCNLIIKLFEQVYFIVIILLSLYLLIIDYINLIYMIEDNPNKQTDSYIKQLLHKNTKGSVKALDYINTKNF